jgi:5-methyltetrahydrofolate--homocysteine methyltransferase
LTDVLDRIAHALANLENSNSLGRLIDEALKQEIPILEILEKGLRTGLNEIGRKYEAGEYFLSELLFGASMMEDSMDILAPRLKAARLESRGQIVLGTVRGDIHDIGKNIFKMLVKGTGFEVCDLGVDVEPEDFVGMVIERKPDVLGLSTLLTTTRPEMKVVIEELRKAGVKDRVRVLLGGNAVTDEFGKETGADGVALDAVQGVDFCKEWSSKWKNPGA